MCRGAILLVLISSLGGCGPSSPPSTKTTSDTLPSLEQRVEFLQRYVTFRRSYRDLGFYIYDKNNGGGLVPGPSEWDIRLIAKVPPEELPQWLRADLVASPTAETDWLNGVPGADWATGIKEWYTRPGAVLGINRERSVVAYRLLKR